VINTRLQVPRYEEDKLQASTLILADQIERVPAKQIGTGQFVLGASKVRPRMNQEFTTSDKLGIYMQVYNLKVDEQSHKANASIQFLVKKGDQEVFKFLETSADMKQLGEQITIERLLPLGTLEPGKYTIEINTTDQVANRTVTRSAEFTVKAAREMKAAANSTIGR
jgi:hypothetical protein